MIHRAEISDLPNLADLARKFYASSHVLDGFNLEHFCSWWKTFLNNGFGVIFIAFMGETPIGALGGLAYPEINSGVLMATEMFWFTDPLNRGAGVRLYRQFEAWSKEKGCKQLRMVHLVDSMPEKLERFYLNNGFGVSEIHYTKEVA